MNNKRIVLNRRTQSEVVVCELQKIVKIVDKRKNDLNIFADHLETMASAEVAAILRREANAAIWVTDPIIKRIAEIQAGAVV